MHVGLKNKQIWLVGLIWALFNIAALSYTTWAGTFFIEMKSISSGVAFFLASFLMIATMILAPIIGRLSDKFGKRRVFLMIASLGMCISFLLIPGVSFPLLILPVVSLGVTAAFLTPALFSLPSEILSPKMAGVGFGVLNTFLGIGVAIGPSLIGYIRDTFSGEPPSYVAMAIFSFLAFICASFLKTR